MTTIETVRRMVAGWAGAVAAAVVMVGCGGGAQGGTAATVGPQGARVAVAGSALQIEIPAGAVQRETEIQVHEVAPRQGEVKAFQVEPEIHSSAGIHVTVRIDDAMGQGKHHLVEVESEVEHGAENEVEDANEHSLSGEVHDLGHVGVKRADDGAGHDAGDDDGAAHPEPGDDKGGAAPAPAPTPVDDKGTI